MSEDGADKPIPQEVISPPRTREAIRADIEREKTSMDMFEPEFEEIGLLMRSLSEEEQKLIDPIITKVAQGEMNSAEAEVAYTGQAKPEFAKSLDFASRIGAKYKKIDELEEEYRPFREEDLKRTVKDLSSRINFDQIMWYVDSLHEHNYSASELFRKLTWLRIFEVDIEDGKLREYYHYSDVEHFQDFFDKLKVFCEENGFLNSAEDERVKNYKPRTEKGAVVEVERDLVVKDVEEITGQLGEYERLVRVYRPNEIYEKGYRLVLDAGLNHLVKLLDLKKNERMGEERRIEIDYDPRLVEAAKAYVAKKRKAYQLVGKVAQDDETREIYYSQFHEINPFDVLAKVEFKGFDGEAPEGTKRYITKDMVVNRFAGYIPAGFLSRLISVEQMPEKKLEGSKTSILGEHRTIYDGNGNVVGSRIYINKSPFIMEGAAPMDQLGAIGNYEHTVAHEMGHCVNDWLTYDEMKAWEMVLETDNANLGWYIAISRMVGKNKGKFEDFAESFAMFSTSPQVLKALSQERFVYMYTLFMSRIHPQSREAFGKWVENFIKLSGHIYEQQGITDESIRSMFAEASDLG